MPRLSDLPDSIIKLIVSYFGTVDQIKLRRVNRKFKSIIDKSDVNQLIINIRYYNFRKLKSTWYGRDDMLKDYDNMISTRSLKHTLQPDYEFESDDDVYEARKQAKFAEDINPNRFTMIERYLKRPRFTNLKFLKIIYLESYDDWNDFENRMFDYLLNNLKRFKQLLHLELEVEDLTIQGRSNINHPGLRVLYIGELNEEGIRVNTPSLEKLCCVGELKPLKIKKPDSIRWLDVENIDQDYNYSCFKNLECLQLSSFHFEVDNLIKHNLLSTLKEIRVNTKNCQQFDDVLKDDYYGDEDLEDWLDSYDGYVEEVNKIFKEIARLKRKDISVYVNGKQVNTLKEFKANSKRTRDECSSKMKK